MVNLHIPKHMVKYLEREQELFIFAAFIAPYGNMLRAVTGFGFTKQMHTYSGTQGTFYRNSRELFESDRHFERVITDHRPKVAQWLHRERELRAQVMKQQFPKTVLEAYQFFQDVLFYNTVIPYRLLSALAHAQTRNRLLQKRFEDIRTHSLYLSLFDKLIKPFLERAGKQCDIPRALQGLLTPSELVDILNNQKKVSKETLELRRAGCIFMLKNDKIAFRYGKVLIEKTSSGVAYGKCAYPGKATGIVRIVNNPQQMTKFSEGNILLSINTNPELMSAIRKAAAIVTDEGGMLCHAAISARELGIPCIIGTGNATRAFQNGDQVEVDAHLGIVRKKQSHF
ncbi:MAG TPA: PEP-utilizing enzyme [Candidatus Nanoarchaeia archaeon]|nr:PEP-utilizing enzyme [Candidatus Nanoarchaeia archaeon]